MEQIQTYHTCKVPLYRCAGLLLWLIVGMVFAGIGVALSIMLHGFPFDKDTDVFMLFVIGVGISLFMGAIFFPLFYVGGEERNEVFLVISLLCGIGFVIGLTTPYKHFVSSTYDYNADNFRRRNYFCVCTACICDFLSYNRLCLSQKRILSEIANPSEPVNGK